MKFIRDHRNDWKIFYVFLTLLGMALLFWGIFKLSFFWNIIIFPLGLFLMIRSFRNYKKTNLIITEIDSKEDITIIKLMNNDIIEINNDQLIYAILVKKFYKPIRAIEIRKKRKINITRGKLIGQIEIKDWGNIEDIAKYFIQKDFKRSEWKFSFNWINFLMIFGILLGLAETQALSYILETKGSLPLPNSNPTIGQFLTDTGSLISDQKVKEIKKSKKAEKRFWDNNK